MASSAVAGHYGLRQRYVRFSKSRHLLFTYSLSHLLFVSHENLRYEFVSERCANVMDGSPSVLSTVWPGDAIDLGPWTMGLECPKFAGDATDSSVIA